jgi:hypothetical protein
MPVLKETWYSMTMISMPMLVLRNAVAKSFVVNVTDGTLDLDFSSSAGNPKLSGIGILLNTALI